MPSFSSLVSDAGASLQGNFDDVTGSLQSNIDSAKGSIQEEVWTPLNDAADGFGDEVKEAADSAGASIQQEVLDPIKDTASGLPFVGGLFGGQSLTRRILFVVAGIFIFFAALSIIKSRASK